MASPRDCCERLGPDAQYCSALGVLRDTGYRREEPSRSTEPTYQVAGLSPPGSPFLADTSATPQSWLHLALAVAVWVYRCGGRAQKRAGPARFRGIPKQEAEATGKEATIFAPSRSQAPPILLGH